MVSDPIADLLTQIRNAIAIKKEYIELPATKVGEEVCKLLKKQGFIADYKKFKDKSLPYKSLHIDFIYSNTTPVITFLRRISRPGQRIFRSYNELPISKGGRGLVIVSTSRGIMDTKEARKKHLGGEVWCEIF